MQSLPGSGLKLGNLVSILKPWVQHEARGTPHMGILQDVSGSEGPQHKIHWGGVVVSRDMVDQELGMFHCHGPQFGGHSFGPSQLGMQHHCPGE